QSKVEARNFEIRKNLLKYDDVMNDQRKVVYEQRKELMLAADVKETVRAMRTEVLDDAVSRCIPAKAYAEQWDVASLHEEVLRLFGLDLPIAEWAKEEGIADEEIRERVSAELERKMATKEANFGPELMRMAEKQILLNVLDRQWKDHLLSLDHLRHGIGLRAYGQRDPLNEYKKEAFDLFENLLVRVRGETTALLSHIAIRTNDPAAVEPPRPVQEMHESRQDPALRGTPADAPEGREPELVGAGGAGANGARPQPARRPAQSAFDAGDPATWGKVQRNAPCPCGSGKKFKHCHGRL